eukprot:1742663-Pleurochrysis_carterae.AAC.1
MHVMPPSHELLPIYFILVYRELATNVVVPCVALQMEPDIICCAKPEKAIDTIERSSIFMYDPEFFTEHGRLNKVSKEKIVEAL